MARVWLIVGGALLGALVVASVVVALLEREEPLAQGTPEAAVQRYLRAVEDGDFKQAHGLLSEELRSECAFEQFAGSVIPQEKRLRNDRITLERTRVMDSVAIVTVRVTQFGGSGPFGTSEYSSEQGFTLRQDSGQWRFTQYPWPYFGCGPFTPAPVRPVPPPPPAPTPSPTP